MFGYYQHALRCYAFLSDVSARKGRYTLVALEEDLALEPGWRDDSYLRIKSLLFGSRWWTRGWTLQELIAPSNVQFYNHNWEYLTDKLGPYKEYISHFCGISIGVLGHFSPLSSVCAGQKMFWAAGRSTTQEEDMAYCLLGIFDVNMPLLYGEGRKAFVRLQEHIIAADEDCTLLLTGQPRQSPSDWYSPTCCDESDRNRDSERMSDTRTFWSTMRRLYAVS
ncbi:hypothetical protein N656DRAFT_74938 [Canariomyces notabilis]|uniref:Heterokaryon incompatibility domain-containing protein n=1 Tax=Canariomyces notabilis TaxID=2074819 RepID=A0AAN6TEC8_9PEZI|nr:hypothetical protein N656DRAFT_74938 [Canariomyces arenarius]